MFVIDGLGISRDSALMLLSSHLTFYNADSDSDSDNVYSTKIDTNTISCSQKNTNIQ